MRTLSAGLHSVERSLGWLRTKSSPILPRMAKKPSRDRVPEPEIKLAQYPGNLSRSDPPQHLRGIPDDQALASSLRQAIEAGGTPHALCFGRFPPQAPRLVYRQTPSRRKKTPLVIQDPGRGFFRPEAVGEADEYIQAGQASRSPLAPASILAPGYAAAIAGLGLPRKPATGRMKSDRAGSMAGSAEVFRDAHRAEAGTRRKAGWPLMAENQTL